jgi:hypothetical protein
MRREAEMTSKSIAMLFLAAGLTATLGVQANFSGGYLDPAYDAAKLHRPAHTSRWLFFDWLPKLTGASDEAVEGTVLEFVRAYQEGAWLLSELGDNFAARQYRLRAETLAAQARSRFDGADGVYGDRLQINAAAMLSGVAAERDYPSIWAQAWGRDGLSGPRAQIISPYFNYFLLQAMARMGHRREALDWMRQYWGGMLDEGATSFWEAYDLSWPKQDPHLGLQADGTTGYFVSLAHGWSSGLAAWLMEEVLGIHAVEPGFRKRWCGLTCWVWSGSKAKCPRRENRFA